MATAAKTQSLKRAAELKVGMAKMGAKPKAPLSSASGTFVIGKSKYGNPLAGKAGTLSKALTRRSVGRMLSSLSPSAGIN